MMYRLLLSFLISCLFTVNQTYGQAHSSIGFSLGANQTFHQYDHELHASLGFVGNVRLYQKLALEPSIGIREVNDYVSARLSAKYYVSNRIFISAGPFYWLGNDNRSGIGTTTSAGYRFFDKPTRNFELSLHGNFAKYIYNSTPVLGLRAAYNFHFRKM